MRGRRAERFQVAGVRSPLSLLLFFLLLGNVIAAAPATLQERFDQANKLYEQGHYTQAAVAYDALLKEYPASPTLLFNAGNSWFKSGDMGRAIAAYRLAERATPRDPAIRFNLNFARKQLVGLPPPQLPAWAKGVLTLTLNEWTILTSSVFWLFMVLLILREIHPPLRRFLRLYTVLTALAILVPLTGLILHLYLRHENHEAVVISATASVRYGPLSEAQSHFQLRSGAEVQILARKSVGKETWLQIEDTTGRSGWMAERDLLPIASKSKPT